MTASRSIFALVSSQPDSVIVYCCAFASTLAYVNFFSTRSYGAALLCTLAILAVWSYVPRPSIPSVDIAPVDGLVQAFGLNRHNVTRCTDFFLSAEDVHLGDDMFTFFKDVDKILNINSWGAGPNVITRIPILVSLLPLCVLHMYFGCIRLLAMGLCSTMMFFLYITPCLVLHTVVK